MRLQGLAQSQLLSCRWCSQRPVCPAAQVAQLCSAQADQLQPCSGCRTYKLESTTLEVVHHRGWQRSLTGPRAVALGRWRLPDPLKAAKAEQLWDGQEADTPEGRPSGLAAWPHGCQTLCSEAAAKLAAASWWLPSRSGRARWHPPCWPAHSAQRGTCSTTRAALLCSAGGCLSKHSLLLAGSHLNPMLASTHAKSSGQHQQQRQPWHHQPAHAAQRRQGQHPHGTATPASGGLADRP